MKTIASAILLASLLATPMSANAVTNFNETFDGGHENWRMTDSVTPLAWFSAGGPTGGADAYVSNTNVNFIGLTNGQTRLAIRGHSSFGSSGGAFVGNWRTSGVYAFSIDVRHNLGVPAKIGVRLANPANSPGASVEPFTLLPSDVWGTLIVPIHPANPGFISFGAGNFTSVFNSIGNIQVNVTVPHGFDGAPGPFHLDIDNPRIVLPGAGGEVVALDAPSFDRWMYPFNASSPLGNRPTASSFGVIDPDFDNRDAQVYFGFILTNSVPPGLGPESYQILRCTMEATMSGGTTEYDPTLDPWTTYLDPTQALYTADADLGRPMELYGAGWRGGWDPWSFSEDGPFQSAPPNWRSKRNLYALGILSNALVDVSNSVDPVGDGSGVSGFDPIPFAVGTAPLTPGDPIPLPTTFTFELDVNHPLIQSYLQHALDDGILGLVIATLHPSVFMGPSVFPVWDQKESIVGTPASLEIECRVAPSLDLGVTGGVRVARWTAGAAPYVMETTGDLSNPTWRPQTVVLLRDGADRDVEVPGTNWVQFIRLTIP